MKFILFYYNLLFYFQGCKIKMDDSGNILIKRIAKATIRSLVPVYLTKFSRLNIQIMKHLLLLWNRGIFIPLNR